VTPAGEHFRAMLRELIAPVLREWGFKGSGQTYRLPSQTYWVRIVFQKSVQSTNTSVRFAVNWDMISKKEWDQRRVMFPDAPTEPPPGMFHSISDESPHGVLMQHWWELAVDDSAETMAKDVLGRIREQIVPHLPPADD